MTYISKSIVLLLYVLFKLLQLGTHLEVLAVFSSKEVGMFSFEANLNTPDSSQWADPKATLKKKQHKESDKRLLHFYCIQTMLLKAQGEQMAILPSGNLLYCS